MALKMTEQLQTALALSAKLKRLIKAKQEVSEACYVDVAGDIFLVQPLIEFLGRIEPKIDNLRTQIKTVINTIPNYNKEIHLEISYIGKEDLKEGFIDISKEGDESSILDLVTGEIVTQKPGKEST
jgi:hypothetical protein